MLCAVDETLSHGLRHSETELVAQFKDESGFERVTIEGFVGPRGKGRLIWVLL